MRLDEGDRIWIKTVLQIGPLKEGGLMRLRGQGDAGRAAVGIAVRTGNHRVDTIRAGASGAERAQDEDDPAFGTNIAIGLRGKCPAKTGWRQHRGLREADEAEGTSKDVHAADNRRVNPAALDRCDRRIQRDERRGARRIYREARPVKVENVRNPV